MPRPPSSSSKVAAARATLASKSASEQPTVVPQPRAIKSREGEEHIDALWVSYKQSPTQQVRNELLEYYLPLVRRTAERIHAKLPATVQVDDLISAGSLGLMDAVEAFSLDRGVRFATFSATRIRGAILDELRSIDWVPRLVRTNAKKLDAAQRQLEAELGRAPAEDEVADRLGLSSGAYRDLVDGARTVAITSLSRGETDSSDDRNEVPVPADAKAPDPVRESQRRTLKAAVTRGLSRAERLLITLYYYEDLTMREVGHVLDLSESRVSQMHTQILTRLRAATNAPSNSTQDVMHELAA